MVELNSMRIKKWQTMGYPMLLVFRQPWYLRSKYRSNETAMC